MIQANWKVPTKPGPAGTMTPRAILLKQEHGPDKADFGSPTAPLGIVEG